MASEPFIQNDFETLLLIFLSLQVIPSHSPFSFKWKFENPIWGKKHRLPSTWLQGLGRERSSPKKPRVKCLGGRNSDVPKYSFLVWAGLLFHLQLMAAPAVGSQQLLKRESGKPNRFLYCQTGSLLVKSEPAACWASTFPSWCLVAARSSIYFLIDTIIYEHLLFLLCIVVSACALKSDVHSFDERLFGAYFMLCAEPGTADKMTSKNR